MTSRIASLGSQALKVFAAALTLAACAAHQPVAEGRLEAPPSSHSADELARALAGRVLIVRLTDDASGRLPNEVVFYGPDGIATAFQARTAETAATLRQFRWSVGSQRLTDGSVYSFISADGSQDGATIQYVEAARRLTFSDVDMGEFFAVAILQECWPAFVPSTPAGIRQCTALEEQTAQTDLAREQAVARTLRSAARDGLGIEIAAAKSGGFSTAPGSLFTNSYGNTLIVTRIDGHRVEYRNQRGQTFKSHALLYVENPAVQGNDAVVAAIDSLWPLAEGKKASAWVYNGEWAWQLSWQVTRRESVTVPAGTFDAWVIEHVERSMGDGFQYRSETWYAPAIGWTARYRGQVVVPPSSKIEEWTLIRAVVPAPSMHMVSLNQR